MIQQKLNKKAQVIVHLLNWEHPKVKIAAAELDAALECACQQVIQIFKKERERDMQKVLIEVFGKEIVPKMKTWEELGAMEGDMWIYFANALRGRVEESGPWKIDFYDWNVLSWNVMYQ